MTDKMYLFYIGQKRYEWLALVPLELPLPILYVIKFFQIVYVGFFEALNKLNF